VLAPSLAALMGADGQVESQPGLPENDMQGGTLSPVVHPIVTRAG